MADFGKDPSAQQAGQGETGQSQMDKADIGFRQYQAKKDREISAKDKEIARLNALVEQESMKAKASDILLTRFIEKKPEEKDYIHALASEAIVSAELETYKAREQRELAAQRAQKEKQAYVSHCERIAVGMGVDPQDALVQEAIYSESTSYDAVFAAIRAVKDGGQSSGMSQQPSGNGPQQQQAPHLPPMGGGQPRGSESEHARHVEQAMTEIKTAMNASNSGMALARLKVRYINGGLGKAYDEASAKIANDKYANR